MVVNGDTFFCISGFCSVLLNEYTAFLRCLYTGQCDVFLQASMCEHVRDMYLAAPDRITLFLMS